jgi:glucose-6-phosphate isomerase
MSLKVNVQGLAADAVKSSIEELVSNRIASRIANKDFTVWGKEAESESAIRFYSHSINH